MSCFGNMYGSELSAGNFVEVSWFLDLSGADVWILRVGWPGDFLIGFPIFRAQMLAYCLHPGFDRHGDEGEGFDYGIWHGWWVTKENSMLRYSGIVSHFYTLTGDLKEC